MAYVIYGLGNAGDEYVHTRHNAGRMAVELYCSKHGECGDFVYDKKTRTYQAKIAGGKKGATAILYEGFMNNSGRALVSLVKNIKEAERTIVIYDDIDLPFGSYKISFDRGDGGHNGLRSVIQHIKTKKFIRIRIGVAQTTPRGVIKKPKDKEQFKTYLLSPFKPDELKQLKKICASIAKAIDCLCSETREKCMSLYHMP
ncbi:MAG: aminoacyl-tRNA hydrolase [bacterium]|nr:aminoacyl-tRNA hydrolase [bacterium]